MSSSAKLIDDWRQPSRVVLPASPAITGVKEKKEQSSNTSSKSSNTSSKSFMDSWNDFQEYKQTHELHFPLQDYLKGTKAGDVVDNIVSAIDDYDKSHYGIADAYGETFSKIGDVVNTGDLSVLNDSYTSPQAGVSAKPVIYSNWSPASKLFGMNQETAFSEHMANTAHQREVADLKAAGLNPVLGISGSGATSVSGSTGASSSAEKVQDNSMLDVLGATAAVITAVATKNPMYGYMVSNIFKAFE